MPIKYIDTKELTTKEARQLEKDGFMLQFVRVTEFKALFKVYVKTTWKSQV